MNRLKKEEDKVAFTMRWKNKMDSIIVKIREPERGEVSAFAWRIL